MENDKGTILAQSGDERERKFRLRWLVALSSIPLFGIVAAFGIAPQTDTQPVQIQTVVENLPLPGLTAAIATPDQYWREERIQPGDTIASLLSRLQVNDQDTMNFLRDSRGAQSLYQLRPGRTVRAETTGAGELLSLQYISADGTMLQVNRDGAGFKASEHAAALERRTVIKSGRIENSLFGATDAVNMPDSVALQMADIFSSDIDFREDLRKGDRFSVVYEVFYDQGVPVKTGRILAAEFVNQGKTYQAVYYQDKYGHSGYYSPDGKNLRKAFLRSPLEFTRISSGFTLARYHPILHKWRAHKGVDFAAPMGTRVKATADGVVAFVGQERGYGNVIMLKHSGKFMTVYGHLKGFAKGLHRGEKVSQGEVIGYVGMTGLATGPHLHYEFRVDGVPKNPMSVDLPTGFPLAAQDKADFLRTAQPLMAELRLLDGTTVASLE